MVLISLLSDVTDPAGYGHFLLRPVSASDLKLQKPDPIPDGSQLEKKFCPDHNPDPARCGSV